MTVRASRGLTAQEYSRKTYLSTLVKKGKLTPGDPRLEELKQLLAKMNPTQRPGISARAEDLIGAPVKRGRGRPKKAVNANAVTNGTPPSVTNNLPDESGQHVSIRLTVPLTVSGQEIQVPVEATIQFQVAELRVVQ